MDVMQILLIIFVVLVLLLIGIYCILRSCGCYAGDGHVTRDAERSIWIDRLPGTSRWPVPAFQDTRPPRGRRIMCRNQLDAKRQAANKYPKENPLLHPPHPEVNPPLHYWHYHPGNHRPVTENGRDQNYHYMFRGTPN